MKTKVLTLTLVVFSAMISVSMVEAVTANAAEPKEYSVVSPDEKLSVTVRIGEAITWGLALDGKTLIEPSPVSMTLTDGTVYGATGKYRTKRIAEADNNGLAFTFNDFELLFKAFNEGVAYRFVSKAKGSFEVLSEQATFTFPAYWNIYVAYVNQHNTTIEKQYSSSFENKYEHISMSQWDSGRIAFLPLLVEADTCCAQPRIGRDES